MGGSNQQGSGGGLFTTSSTGGSGGGEACAATEEEATLVNRPVDIIFVIDNSGSMQAEIEEVEAQINKNFAAIINAANPPIDYRVVMVSRYGNSSSRNICIAAPLGGIPDNDNNGHCDSVPSSGPVNTAKFFHHSRLVGSHDALCRLLEEYNDADDYGLQPNGYKDVLRNDSFKFFAVITDDGVSCSFNGKNYSDGNNATSGQTAANNWDLDVMALGPQHFGTDPMNRNYSFWSIVALSPFNPTASKPYGDPYPPDATVAPITSGECTPDAEDPGTGYQALSLLTGGYRYPTCGLDYTEIFQLMAQGVIQGAQVPCEFDIPDPPPGETLDLETVEVIYTSGGTPVDTYTQVPTQADCTPTSFYIDMDKIILCPDACVVVQNDENAKVNVRYGCENMID